MRPHVFLLCVLLAFHNSHGLPSLTPVNHVTLSASGSTLSTSNPAVGNDATTMTVDGAIEEADALDSDLRGPPAPVTPLPPCQCCSGKLEYLPKESISLKSFCLNTQFCHRDPRYMAQIWNEYGALLTKAADVLKVPLVSLTAVFFVEGATSGFVGDQMKVYFDDKRFSVELNNPGQYDQFMATVRAQSLDGPAKAMQRLQLAQATHDSAALRAAAMGWGNVQGYNAKDTGYTSPQEMFTALAGSAEAQVAAVVNFIQAIPCAHLALKTGRYEDFARIYGPSAVYLKKGSMLRHFALSMKQALTRKEATGRDSCQSDGRTGACVNSCACKAAGGTPIAGAGCSGDGNIQCCVGIDLAAKINSVQLTGGVLDSIAAAAEPTCPATSSGTNTALDVNGVPVKSEPTSSVGDPGSEALTTDPTVNLGITQPKIDFGQPNVGGAMQPVNLPSFPFPSPAPMASNVIPTTVVVPPTPAPGPMPAQGFRACDDGNGQCIDIHNLQCSSEVVSRKCMGEFAKRSDVKCCRGTVTRPAVAAAYSSSGSNAAVVDTASAVTVQGRSNDFFGISRDLNAPICPPERRLTRVCKEIGGGSRNEPPNCGGQETAIGSGYVCREEQGSTPTLPAPTRQQILERAKVWIDQRIRYSQRRYHKGYRTDCSGFVSMAWGLGSSSPSSLGTSHFCCGDAPRVFIPCKDLSPGDAMVTVTKGHVILFHHWINEREFVVWEEMGTASGTVEAVWEFTSTPPTATQGTVRRAGSGGTKQYKCMRRNGLVG